MDMPAPPRRGVGVGGGRVGLYCQRQRLAIACPCHALVLDRRTVNPLSFGMSDSLHESMRSDIRRMEDTSPKNLDDCFYCSAKAVSRDHTIPHSFVRNNLVSRHYSTDCVPACCECNTLLSNKIHHSLSERIEFLLHRVAQRHAKTLKLPDWTDDELEEMGESLQSSIKTGMLEKLITRHRLASLHDNYEVAIRLEGLFLPVCAKPKHFSGP